MSNRKRPAALPSWPLDDAVTVVLFACKVEVCAGCGKYRWQPADGLWSDWLDFEKLPVFDNAR